MELQMMKEGAVFKIETIKDKYRIGDYYLPQLGSSNKMPTRLTSFGNKKSQGESDSWIHFYQDDSKFMCLWNNPSNYLATFKRYQGVITPDFSVYRNMPRELQRQSVYKNRAIGHWLTSNGVEVIPNIRWGDCDTFDFCFEGIEQGSNLAVGNHGCYSKPYDKQKFKEGIYHMIDILNPSGIVLYGTLPEYLVRECQKSHITLRHFKSDFATSRRKECA